MTNGERMDTNPIDNDPEAIAAINYLRSKYSTEQIMTIYEKAWNKNKAAKYWHFDGKIAACPECKGISLRGMTKSCGNCGQVLLQP